MTPTEQRYAQIEKEALALTWACERLWDYLLGLHFLIQTDHKPLFSVKALEELPIRVQRFRTRMMRYRFNIEHIPGKDLVVADMLSRAPTELPTTEDQLFDQEGDAYIQAVMRSIPASDKVLEEVKQKQELDEACSKEGWPERTACTNRSNSSSRLGIIRNICSEWTTHERRPDHNPFRDATTDAR